MNRERYYNLGSLLAVVGVVLALLMILGLIPVSAVSVGGLFILAFVSRLT